MSDFSVSVLATIRRESLLPAGSRVVIGVSGGPDSMALLTVLDELRDELGLELSAAHLDHALRPDSAEDGPLVAEWTKRLGVPLTWERVDWSAHGGTPTANVEARAREVRYEFLLRVADRAKGVVAVGHHADDRLETFLARLLQGAGPGGLSGPRYRREDGVVRPLLDRTREEILAYLAARSVPFRHDPTNRDGSNLRSRIRADIVPRLRRENPRIVESVARTANLLADLDEVLNEVARAALPSLIREEGATELALDGPRGRPYHPIVLSTLLREAVARTVPERPRLPSDSIGRCARAWKEGRRFAVDLPGGVRIAVSEDLVRVARTGPGAEPPAARDLPVPGGVVWGEAGGPRVAVEVRSPPAPGRARASGPRVAWIDGDRVSGSLRVRGRVPGDRYRPVGLEGSVKVQDLFVDRKIPRGRREAVPVIVDDEGILWIPGFRVDHRARITEDTKTALRVEIEGRVPSVREKRETMTLQPTTTSLIGNVMITNEEIQARVAELGREIAEEYGDQAPILVNILKGGFVFLADLTRAMEIACEMDFMVVSSYEDKTESSGVVRILSDLGLNIEGRHVLIVEDIVDTGLTLEYIRELLLARNPASLKIVTLLDKHEKRQVAVPIDWIGFRIPDEFVVGYGLDYAQRFRNLPYITVLDESDLPELGAHSNEGASR